MKKPKVPRCGFEGARILTKADLNKARADENEAIAKMVESRGSPALAAEVRARVRPRPNQATLMANENSLDLFCPNCHTVTALQHDVLFEVLTCQWCKATYILRGRK